MTKSAILPALIAALLIAPSVIAQPAEPDAVNGADMATYVRAALPLDEPRHLCIDLPGHGDMIDLEAAFTVHTCKDGLWNLDQRIAWTDDGAGLEMPQYSKCLAAAGTNPGAAIVLKDCGDPMAGWTSENARLKLASDTSLCMTIADTKSELTPGGKRFPQRYRARAVSLESCSDDALERQLWSFMQPLDLAEPLLPPSGSLPYEGE